MALTAESDHYSFWELLSSIYFAAFVFIMILPFATKISAVYDRFFWECPEWFLPAFYGLATLILIVFGFYFSNIPFIDRIVIPKDVKSSTVKNRAFRHFAESGIYETEGHSGILIFVSYLERQVRIICDSGIAKKIPQDLWNIIADDLAGGIKSGNTKEGFLRAIEKCGELLTEHFPCTKENPNELPDGLVILEN